MVSSHSFFFSSVLLALAAALWASVAHGQSVSSTSSPSSSSSSSGSATSGSSSSSALAATTLAPATFSFSSIGPAGPSIVTVINGTATTIPANMTSTMNMTNASSTMTSSSSSLNLSTVSLGLITTRADSVTATSTGMPNAALAAAQLLRSGSFEGAAGLLAASVVFVLAGAVLL